MLIVCKVFFFKMEIIVEIDGFLVLFFFLLVELFILIVLYGFMFLFEV